jgi:hypothetical protein
MKASQMQWLVRMLNNRKPPRAHIWVGDDTACGKVASRQLYPEFYKVADHPGDHQVCAPCAIVVGWREPFRPRGAAPKMRNTQKRRFDSEKRGRATAG